MVLCLVSLWMVAQQSTAVIGEVKNNVPVITNTADAIKVLKAGLSDNAEISNLSVEWVGDKDNAYFLIGKVNGDDVNGKAIKLYQNGNVLQARSGPGIEYNCVGSGCSTCILVIRHWRVTCVCDDPTHPSGICNMIVKYILTPW